MLAVIRIILLGLLFIMSLVVGLVVCIARPFHRNNVCVMGHFYGFGYRILGVDMEVRTPDSVKQMDKPCVYIANHQNSYDLFTISNAIQPGTVSIGKKSLVWVPFFGQIYWLTGNILIDRKNSTKARGTINNAVEQIKERAINVWVFPEGTRSYGKGLLPFKTGAFHTALQAQVPVVPVCMNTTTGRIKLNRWNNGRLIVEIQEPDYTTTQDSTIQARDLAVKHHEAMLATIARLDAELDTDKQ